MDETFLVDWKAYKNTGASETTSRFAVTIGGCPEIRNPGVIRGQKRIDFIGFLDDLPTYAWVFSGIVTEKFGL